MYSQGLNLLVLIVALARGIEAYEPPFANQQVLAEPPFADEQDNDDGMIRFGDMLVRKDQLRVINVANTQEDDEAEMELWVLEKTKKWPKGKVPYEIDSSLSDTRKNSIKAAIKKYDDAFPETCVKFSPKTATDTDYVQFKSGTSCSSPLGKQGGKQIIYVTSGCDDTMVVMHEMMHALGRQHEHQRYDRDNYVKVIWSNVNGGKTNTAFKKLLRTDFNDQGYSYDIRSIMHYPSWASSTTSGLNTMEPLDTATTPIDEMGAQHPSGDFSYWDKRQLRTFYGCPDH